jgi:hypothetical protein
MRHLVILRFAEGVEEEAEENEWQPSIQQETEGRRHKGGQLFVAGGVHWNKQTYIGTYKGGKRPPSL